MVSYVVPSWVARFSATLVFLIPLVAIFSTRSLVFLLIVGGLVALYTHYKNPLVIGPRAIVMTSFLLLAWGALSAFWSLNGLESLLLSLRIGGIVIFGWMWCRLLMSFNASQSQSLQKAFLTGVMMAVILLITNRITGYSLQIWYPNFYKTAYFGSAVLVLLAWPCFYLCIQSFGWVVAFLVMTIFFFGLFIVHYDAGPVAFIFGSIGFALSLLKSQYVRRALMVITPVVVLTAPFLVVTFLTTKQIDTYKSWVLDSAHLQRLYIWNYVGTHILEKPLLGWGMDSSGHKQLAKNIDWSFENSAKDVSHFKTEALPSHPHNAILQLWLELGVFGALLGAIVAVTILRSFRSLNALPHAVAIGAFVTASTIACVSFGFWECWFQTSLWLAGGMMVLAVQPRSLNFA